MSEEKGKWKEILLSKYYSGDGSNQGYGSQHSWWWSDLGKACDEGEGEGWFHNHVAWKVGNRKLGFGKMHGWTITSLNLCFLDCIPYP